MSDWPTLFEAELIRLGLQPRRARQLSDETAGQAAEQTASPSEVFGPAHLYARHLVAELSAPLAASDLLLLDEPYQGFDQGTYLDFWQQVFAWRDAGRAVVVVTHLLHDLQNVDHVLDLGAFS